MNINSVMREVEQNISRLTNSEAFLIATCIENMLNGSTWGFVREDELKEFGGVEANNNNLTNLTRVKNEKGQPIYLVEANDVKDALKVLQKVAPSLVDEKLVKDFIVRSNTAKDAFTEFIRKSRNGKGFKGYIGLNSINKTTTMTYKGERHKAFQVDIKWALTWLSINHDNEVRVVIQDEISGVGSYRPSELLLNLDSHLNLSNKLTTSEGRTSVVIALAVNNR